MRVLFVSGIDGFCHRYHVLHRAAQLARRGVASTVRSFLDPRLMDDVAAHDVVFLYRVPETAMTRAAIAAARRRGAAIVGSIDDLIFSPDSEDQPALDHLAPDERALWRRGIERYRATLLACDAFLGPTQPLVDAAARLGVPAFLHRNSVSPIELALGARAASAAARTRSVAASSEPRGADGRVWLGYLSGTPTHDQDFATMAAVVLELMRADARVWLRVVGPLAIPPELGAVADRIERVALVSWTALPELIAGIDIVLAPLDLRRRFAYAKGEVKYLEAAAVGRPVIASPVPSFEHAIGAGVRGRLAGDTAAWRAALQELVADPAARRSLGEAAHADLEQRWDEKTRAQELLDLLEEARSSSRRATEGRAASRAAAGGHSVHDGCAEAGAAGEARDGGGEREARDCPDEGEARDRAEGVESPAPARLALEPDAFPLRSDPPPAAISPPLGPGALLTQRLRLDAAAPARLDVFTVTYGQALEHRVAMRLRREDGSAIAEQSVAAADAPDRGWLGFDLEPAGLACGATCVLELEALGSGDGNALSFGLTGDPSVATEAAELNGSPLAGTLALRAFAPWSLVAPDVGAPAHAVEARA